MMELNNYEITLLLRPDLAPADIDSLVTQHLQVILKDKGRIIDREKAVHRQLAYPIKKKEHAFDVGIIFEAVPETIVALEKKLNRDENVLRFLVVRLGKETLLWKQKQKAVSSSAKA